MNNLHEELLELLKSKFKENSEGVDDLILNMSLSSFIGNFLMNNKKHRLTKQELVDIIWNSFNENQNLSVDSHNDEFHDRMVSDRPILFDPNGDVIK